MMLQIVCHISFCHKVCRIKKNSVHAKVVVTLTQSELDALIGAISKLSKTHLDNALAVALNILIIVQKFLHHCEVYYVVAHYMVNALNQ